MTTSNQLGAMMLTDEHFDAAQRTFHSILVLEMSELCDRNSPEDDPTAMVANDKEMAGCVERSLERLGCVIVPRALLSASKPAAPAQSTSDQCPDCFGAGVYAKALILPEPPDITCARCGGRGTIYTAPQPTQPAKAGEALTDEQMLDAIKSACNFDGAGVEQWRTEALIVGRAVERASLAKQSAVVLDGERAAFEWPPLPSLPGAMWQCGSVGLFTSHQMQGYANAYVELIRAASPQATATQAEQTQRSRDDSSRSA